MGKPPLPVIHPVVFYHGTETWTASTELTGLHKPANQSSGETEPFGGYPVNLRYHLIDLKKIPPEAIDARTRARACAGMIALKYIKRKLKKHEAELIAKATTPITLPEGFRVDLTHYLFMFVPSENN